MVKEMNKLYLITTNDKKFHEWAKKVKKTLKGQDIATDAFNQAYGEVSGGNYLVRASFVCYWEIYTNNDLARLAPAITQATMIHMLHRFAEQNKIEEAQVVEQLIGNFVRLLVNLDGEPNEEE